MVINNIMSILSSDNLVFHVYFCLLFIGIILFCLFQNIIYFPLLHQALGISFDNLGYYPLGSMGTLRF